MAEAPTYRTLKTPVAGLRSLGVIVDDSVVAENPDILPDEGTLYAGMDQKLMPQELGSLWNNYRYVEQQDLGNGKFMLIFVKVRTNNQRNTPYRTLTGFGNHRWCPILKALVFIKEPGFPRSTNGVKAGQGAVIAGPSYYKREVFQGEVNEGSRFIETHYFSDIPFIVPSYPVPVPRSIAYDVPGIHGSFPECIGPEIRIPKTRTASIAYIAGSSIAASGVLNGQFFAETDFDEWSPYFVSAQQTFNNGYDLTKLMVLPPIEVPEDSIS